ncbi:MAG: PspC domain-containing protein [Candidatus Heimdallarchaeota archaeon]
MTEKKMPFEEEIEEDEEYEEDIRLLFRSNDDFLFRGVLGGLAEFWGINPTIIRLLFLLSIILTGGLMIIIYFVLVKLIPIEPN